MPIKTTHLHESKTLTTGQDTTLQVPTYGTIHNLVLRFTTSAGADVTEAQIRSEIAKIRFAIDGKDKVNISAAKLLDFFESLGNRVAVNTGVGGQVELNVGRLLFADAAQRDFLGFGSADVSVMQVTITAGTLSAIANVQAITRRTKDIKPLGSHCSIIDYAQNYNATGEHTVDTLPRDASTAYAALLINNGASGVISHSEIRLNNETICEKVPAAVNQQFLANDRLVQPSGYFVHGLNDGQGGSILPMNGVSEFRILTTFSTAAGAAGYSIIAVTINGSK